MREERGRIQGDIVVAEPFELWGSISGNVKVIDGGKFYMRGAIYGNLVVEFGGRVHIFGNVSGDLKIMRGSKVIVSGVIGGDAINDGGRMFVDNAAKVVGKVKTRRGDTRIEPKATIMEQ
jgi:cytoskeletal protein CcmA (bactofilin family)